MPIFDLGEIFIFISEAKFFLFLLPTFYRLWLVSNFFWPGNVRQLRNAIEKIVIFSHTAEIGYDEVMTALELGSTLHPNYSGDNDKNILTLKNAIHNFERDYLQTILQKNNWKINQTAQALGMDRSNLFKKMRKYKLKV